MEKWYLLDPSGFEYLKTGERVGKGKGREISDWLFASVTLTRMLAPGSPRPVQKRCHLAIRHAKRPQPVQEREHWVKPGRLARWGENGWPLKNGTGKGKPLILKEGLVL